MVGDGLTSDTWRTWLLAWVRPQAHLLWHFPVKWLWRTGGPSYQRVGDASTYQGTSQLPWGPCRVPSSPLVTSNHSLISALCRWEPLGHLPISPAHMRCPSVHNAYSPCATAMRAAHVPAQTVSDVSSPDAPNTTGLESAIAGTFPTATHQGNLGQPDGSPSIWAVVPFLSSQQ